MEREKYEVYCKMFKQAQVMMEQIENEVLKGESKLLINGYEIKVNYVWSVFISVCDEEKGTYFIDLEFKNGHNEYQRIYGERKLEIKKGENYYDRKEKQKG